MTPRHIFAHALPSPDSMSEPAAVLAELVVAFALASVDVEAALESTSAAQGASVLLEAAWEALPGLTTSVADVLGG